MCLTFCRLILRLCRKAAKLYRIITPASCPSGNVVSRRSRSSEDDLEKRHKALNNDGSAAGLRKELLTDVAATVKKIQEEMSNDGKKIIMMLEPNIS